MFNSCFEVPDQYPTQPHPSNYPQIKNAKSAQSLITNSKNSRVSLKKKSLLIPPTPSSRQPLVYHQHPLNNTKICSPKYCDLICPQTIEGSNMYKIPTYPNKTKSHSQKICFTYQQPPFIDVNNNQVENMPCVTEQGQNFQKFQRTESGLSTEKECLQNTEYKSQITEQSKKKSISNANKGVLSSTVKTLSSLKVKRVESINPNIDDDNESVIQDFDSNLFFSSYPQFSIKQQDNEK